MQFIGMSVADKQVETQNNLAKAGSSWKSHSPCCSNACKDCCGFHFQERKSEDTGPWRRPGLGREWDPPVAHFEWKC